MSVFSSSLCAPVRTPVAAGARLVYVIRGLNVTYDTNHTDGAVTNPIGVNSVVGERKHHEHGVWKCRNRTACEVLANS